MRFFAVLAVLFGVTAGAVALGDPDARPVPRRLRIPLSSVQDRVVLEVLEDGSKPSAIQGLPVPASAVRAHGENRCTGVADCEEEIWTLRTVSGEALRDWYSSRIDVGTPWRGLQPCGGDFTDESDIVFYRWWDERAVLDLQVTGTTIRIRALQDLDTGPSACN